VMFDFAVHRNLKEKITGSPGSIGSTMAMSHVASATGTRYHRSSHGAIGSRICELEGPGEANWQYVRPLATARRVCRDNTGKMTTVNRIQFLKSRAFRMLKRRWYGQTASVNHRKFRACTEEKQTDI
jgi:hypothetical protein